MSNKIRAKYQSESEYFCPVTSVLAIAKVSSQHQRRRRQTRKTIKFPFRTVNPNGDCLVAVVQVLVAVCEEDKPSESRLSAGPFSKRGPGQDFGSRVV